MGSDAVSGWRVWDWSALARRPGSAALPDAWKATRRGERWGGHVECVRETRSHVFPLGTGVIFVTAVILLVQFICFFEGRVVCTSRPFKKI